MQNLLLNSGRTQRQPRCCEKADHQKQHQPKNDQSYLPPVRLAFHATPLCSNYLEAPLSIHFFRLARLPLDMQILCGGSRCGFGAQPLRVTDGSNAATTTDSAAFPGLIKGVVR